MYLKSDILFYVFHVVCGLHYDNVEIVRSVGMIGFCPYISSTGMNAVTELCVVRSAHKA